MAPTNTNQFQTHVWAYYHDHGRDLPWRREPLEAYPILVSEIMLQQTQVARVIPKYEAFLGSFPTIASLAAAPLAAVLKSWNGLGYNRRAKYLHEAAKTLAPKSRWQLANLTACKGIGYNTAAAVCTYVYNEAHPFIETNIRTVFIHHFFHDHMAVTDSELLPLVQASLDKANPREWYWALMDYGAYLKASVGNLSRVSKHYAKQSTFSGSNRQLRGQVLRLLAGSKHSEMKLQTILPDQRLQVVLATLQKEGLITRQGRYYLLPS